MKVLDAEGTCLYWQGVSDGSGGDSAQVIIIFDLNPTNGAPNDTRLQIVNRSFRLSCSEAFTIHLYEYHQSAGMFGIAQSPWSSILGDTFGTDINILLAPGIVEDFIAFMQESLPSYESISACDTWVAIHLWLDCPSSWDRHVRQAFFAIAAKRLPELAPLAKGLERFPKPGRSKPSANDTYESCWTVSARLIYLYRCSFANENGEGGK